MNINAYTNFRIRKETQRKLKIIAAIKGESMLDALDRLVSAEYEQIQIGEQKNDRQQKDQT